MCFHLPLVVDSLIMSLFSSSPQLAHPALQIAEILSTGSLQRLEKMKSTEPVSELVNASQGLPFKMRPRNISENAGIRIGAFHELFLEEPAAHKPFIPMASICKSLFSAAAACAVYSLRLYHEMNGCKGFMGC